MLIGKTISNKLEPLIQSLKPVFHSTVHVDYPTVRLMINDSVSSQIVDGRRLI